MTWITLRCHECQRHVQVDTEAAPVLVWRCPYCAAFLTKANAE